MKALLIENKQSHKERRRHGVLLALIEYYIKTAKPVGSATLKETGFPSLSSATIRNYFSKLEEEGYLTQQHSSAGRIPTSLAYRFYAEHQLQTLSDPLLTTSTLEETKEITHYLQQAAQRLSESTQTAVFLSAPRFDQDFVVAIKLIQVTVSQIVCLLVTEFGEIQTILLPNETPLDVNSLKNLEDYCQARLKGLPSPPLSLEEQELAQNVYNEAMLRYIVRYSHFIDEEIYRTGFSKLLFYPEFRDPHLLANSLSLFENAHSMRLLLRKCIAQNTLKFWIGEDLLAYAQQTPYCAVLASPYRVNGVAVGAVGLLGPMRLPYDQCFKELSRFSNEVSDLLTRSLYKFKMTYRQPEQTTLYLPQDNQQFLDQSHQQRLIDQPTNP